jgi:hypothetical protein
MSRLSKELYQRCQTTLLKCSEFDNDTSIVGVFVTDELRPFRDRLPAAVSKVDRVGRCLDFLLDQRLGDGQPVLPLFLEALCERYQEGDALRDELWSLASEIRARDSEICQQKPVTVSRPYPEAGRSMLTRGWVLWRLAALVVLVGLGVVISAIVRHYLPPTTPAPIAGSGTAPATTATSTLTSGGRATPALTRTPAAATSAPVSATPPTETPVSQSMPMPAQGYALPLADPWTIVYDGLGLWAVYQGQLVRLELVEAEERFRAAGQLGFPHVISLAWDESRGLYWAVQGTPWSCDSEPFARVGRAGGVIDIFAAPRMFSGYPGYVAWDGEYLWVTSEGGLFKLQPVGDSNELEVVDSYTYEEASGLAWDGDNLWLLVGHVLNKLDRATRPTCQIDISALPTQQLPGAGVVSGDWRGLAWDGQFLWIVSNELYRIDPAACR